MIRAEGAVIVDELRQGRQADAVGSAQVRTRTRLCSKEASATWRVVFLNYLDE